MGLVAISTFPSVDVSIRMIDRTHTAAASSEDMSITFEVTGDSSSYIRRWFCQVDGCL